MKNYIIVALAILVVILFLLRGCNKPLPPKETVVRIIDTIIQFDTIVDTFEVHHTELIPIKVETMDLSDTNLFLFKYHYPIQDSLLDGTIIALSNDRPQIDFSYKLKQFTIDKNTVIKDSIYKEVVINKNKLYLGGEMLVSPFLNQAYVGVSFEHKRGHLFNVDLGFHFNNNQRLIKVGYKRIISFKK
jgi:hypothetical protein